MLLGKNALDTQAVCGSKCELSKAMVELSENKSTELCELFIPLIKHLLPNKTFLSSLF